MEVRDIVQETVIKPSPRKRNAKRQNGCLRRPYKKLEKKRSERQRIKEKIYPLESTVPKNSKGDMKTFFSDQCKEIEENNKRGKTGDLFKKIRDTKGTFHEKCVQ